MRALLTISFSTLLLFSCGTSAEVTSAIPEGKSKTSSQEVTVKEQRLFLDASKHKILENYDKAMKLFEQVVSLNKLNDAAHYELSKLYKAIGKDDLAQNHANTAYKIDPRNKWYAAHYSETMAGSGKFLEAASIYEELLDKYPSDYNYYFDWAYMLTKAEEYEQAIAVYDELESKTGIEERVVIQKEKLYLKINKVDEAAEELKKLIESFPGSNEYKRMLADLYEANGMNDKAIAIYEDLVSDDEQDPYALLALADLQKANGNHDKYIEFLAKAFRSDQLDIDSKIRGLYPYIEFNERLKGEMDDAYLLAKILTEVHPEEAKAHAIRGDLYYLSDDLKEAELHYRNSLKLQSDIFTVWQQLMLIYDGLGNDGKVIETADEAMELFPNQPSIYLMKGSALQKQDKLDQAIQSYDKGQKLSYSNPRLKAQFFSSMGDVYHEQKKFAASDSAYERSIQLDGTNPYVMNNYAYYLSLRNEKLEKAKELSMKSNQLLTNNPSFLDTYAWILYKMELYKEAKEWLEKALLNGGEDQMVVLEHYGDVMYKLNDVEKAVTYWKKARALGNESELLGKKIADEKLYEE